MEKFLDRLAAVIIWTGWVVVLVLGLALVAAMLYGLWQATGWWMLTIFGFFALILAYGWAYDRVKKHE